MNNLYELSKDNIQSNNNLVAVKIIDHHGSAPRKTGSIMIVDKEGKITGSVGGGVLEKYCIETALEVFKEKKDFTQDFKLSKADGNSNTQTVKYLDSICSGDVKIAFYYLNTLSKLDSVFGKSVVSPRVYVFGAGHVGYELSLLLEHLGFDVVVYDDRKDFANEKRFPFVQKIVCAPYTDILKHIKINNDDYIAIMTHGHTHDWEVLEQLSGLDVKYIGCIGSKSKVALTKKHLLDVGIPQEKIDKIHAPIGFDLKGDTPQEVAVAIAGEMILVKNS